MQKDRRNVEQYFANPETLFAFMRRTRKPVFHKSNVFFRDIEYAVHDYFDRVQRQPITLPEAERMAREIVQRYTERGLLREVSNQAYVLNMPEFDTPKSGTYSMLTFQGAPIPGTAEDTTRDENL